jgi:phenylalanyl-tRNA synthetase beta chain
MEEGQALSLFAGDVEIGLLGLVRADIRRTWRMAEPVALAELSAAPWLRAGRAGPALRPVPAYPAVVRDVALVVDEGVTHDSIVRAMRESAPEELTRIELFDIFRGEGIGAGRKSVAYSLVYRSMCRTLTDEDANRYHEAVKDAVKRKLNAQIREG